MKKNCVGVLTIPNAENYGSVLQSYGQKIFLENFHVDVTVINYKPEYLNGRYRIINIDFSTVKRFIKSTASSLLNFGNSVIKKKKFNDFRKRYLELKKPDCKKIEQIKNFDAIVVGGDQLWNTRITKYNKCFFLDNCEIKQKIAFSVSFGYVDKSEEEDEFFRKYINNFDAIYTRENYDVNYVRSIFKSESVGYVLDPTLLINESEWDKISSKRLIKDDYILVYCFGEDSQIINTANRLKKKYKLDVYIINNSIKRVNKNNYINVRKVGPNDFVSLFKYAKYVVTNSFHGVAFSIIYKKNFKCIPYVGTEGRMISLVNLLKLDLSLDLEDLESNLVYSEANKMINAERKKAQDIIKKLLEV